MATGKKITVGILLLLVFSTLIYITLPNQMQIKVEKSKSSFYIFENNSWVLSATEQNNLYNGTKSIGMISTNISYTILNNNLTEIIRIANYSSGVSIKDTYLFDGSTGDIERFPISHQIRIINGKGLIYQYTAGSLYYSKGTILGIESPQVFGKGMKIYWQDGNYYSKITQLIGGKGKLIIKYKVSSDDETFNIRLFDPPSITTYINIFLQGANVSRYYELGTNATVTINITDGTNILNLGFNVTINQTGYGINYTSGNGTLTFNISTGANNEFFNDSTVTKNLTYSGADNHTFYITFNKYDTILTASLNLSGWLNDGTYPEAVRIYINDSLDKEYSGPFKIGTVQIDYLNDSTEAKNLTYNNSGSRYGYLKLLKTADVLNASVNLSGFRNLETYTSLQGYELNYELGASSDTTGQVLNFTNESVSTYAASCYSGSFDKYRIYNLTDKAFVAGSLVLFHYSWDYILHTTGGWGSANLSIWNYTSGVWQILAHNQTTKAGDCFIKNIGINLTSDLIRNYTLRIKFHTQRVDTYAAYPACGSWGTCLDGTSGEAEGSTEGRQVLIRMYYNVTTYPRNPKAEVGIVDYDYSEWNQTGMFNGTSKTNDFSSQMNAYLASCSADVHGYCHVPIKLISDSSGVLQISAINITYNFDPNPVSLNVTELNNYLSLAPIDNLKSLANRITPDSWNWTKSGGIGWSWETGNGTIKSPGNATDGNPSTYAEAHANESGRSGGGYIYFNYSNPNLLKTGVWSAKIMGHAHISSCYNGTAWLQFYYFHDNSGLPLDTYSTQLNESCMRRTVEIKHLFFEVEGAYAAYFWDANFTIYGGDINIPIKISSSDSGIVEIKNLNFSYHGSDNISITVNFEGDATYRASNNTKSIQVVHSNYSYAFPNNVYYLEFIPRTSNDKNVTPFGQTNSRPILNLTTLNYDKKMNISLYLNQSSSCVNISFSLINSTSNLTWLQAGKWFNTWTNLSMFNHKGIWLVADYNCSNLSWNLYYPHLFIRGCCVDCVCAEEVK